MSLNFALRNLLRNPRRTLGILCVIAFGTSSILLFHGFNNGLMTQIRENMVHAFYGHGRVCTRGYGDRVYEKPSEHWIRNWPEVQARVGALPGVVRLFPRLPLSTLLSNGRVSVNGLGEGVMAEEESKFFNRLIVEQGVMLTDQPDGILLGKGLASALGVKPGDALTLLGNTLRGTINSLDLTVTGIFHSGIREVDNSYFRVQLKQAQAMLDTDQIECVSLSLRGFEDWPGVAAAISREFPVLEAVPFAKLAKLYYQNTVDWLDAQFRVILIIILVIVLLGILNMIVSSILERKQEIGNLRANGESFGEILLLLEQEGVALGILGSLLGIAVAFLLGNGLLHNGIPMPPGPGITQRMTVVIMLDPGMAVKTIWLGTGVSCVSMLLAGWRVARMPIAEMLR